jgi:hypothetical protein
MIVSNSGCSDAKNSETAFSLNTLVEAVSSLSLTEKRQIQEIIEQQIFEAEEDAIEQDPQVLAEILAAHQAYQNGDYQTIQAYAL